MFSYLYIHFGKWTCQHLSERHRVLLGGSEIAVVAHSSLSASRISRELVDLAQGLTNHQYKYQREAGVMRCHFYMLSSANELFWSYYVYEQVSYSLIDRCPFVVVVATDLKYETVAKALTELASRIGLNGKPIDDPAKSRCESCDQLMDSAEAQYYYLCKNCRKTVTVNSRVRDLARPGTEQVGRSPRFPYKKA